MIWNSLKIALRNILNNKQSYILNVIGLIMSLTVCFIVLIYTLYEYKEEKEKFTIENVCQVQEIDKKWGWPSYRIPIGLAEYLWQNVPGVSNVVKFGETGDYNIQINDKVYNEWTFHFVDTNFMGVINKTTLVGNCDLINRGDVLLTKKLALKYFGTINCIGETLTVFGHKDKAMKFQVSGVFDYPFQRETRPQYNLVASINVLKSLHENFDLSNSEQNTDAYIVLKENADQNLIVNQIKRYYIENKKKDYLHNRTIKLTTGKSFFDYTGKKVKTTIIISSLILLISIINFLIFNNAQFWKRSRSIGIHKIIGSRPLFVLIFSFTEFFIITTFCAIVAFFIAINIIPFIKNLFNEAIDIQYLPLALMFLFGLLISFAISFATSICSLYLSTQKPINLLSQLFNKGAKGKVVNSTLVTIQIASTTFFIIMLMTTSRQLNYVQNIDWGFNAEEVLRIEMDEESINDHFQNFQDRLDQIPGVIASSGCWHVPPEGSKFFIGFIDEEGKRIMIDRNMVGYSYLSLMGIKLKSGRDFDRDIDKSGNNIIVNQQYLDVCNIQNPYDTLVKIENRHSSKTIIGVIDEYHMRGMHEKTTPQIIELDPTSHRNLLVKIKPDNVMATLDQIKDTYHNYFPNDTYKMGFVEDSIQNLYQEQRNFNTMIRYLTIISVIIACMGLFGFVLNEINKRIKEIGIRKVNGAKVIEILSLLNNDLVKWVSMAVLISCPIAYLVMEKWLESFAYKINISWWIFALAGLLSLIIAMITVTWQSWRAAVRNPVEALKYE